MQEQYTGRHRGSSDVADDSAFEQTIKNILHDELSHFLSDVEFRLGQTREIEARIARSEGGQVATPTTVYAEDINIGRHQITGYTVTANSPSSGSIAWSSVHVVYNGVDYTIANGSTANKYVWFVKPASGTSATLSTGNTKPTLGPTDALIFVNNGGTPISALESSVPPTVADGAISNAELAPGAVTADKTNFYDALVAQITSASNKADLAQATADGSIDTYFQATAPWANGDATAGGATNPAGKVGDVWYGSSDGHAYRWSGASGSPANTWVLISDTDIATALANAQTALGTAQGKITTFYAASTSTPSATAVGDMWVVTDKNNLLRRASAVGTGSWADIQFGDAAISGIAGSKVGTGISASNVTTGTMNGTLVGSGISATNVTTGTLNGGLVGNGTLTPTKLNILQHILY